MNFAPRQCRKKLLHLLFTMSRIPCIPSNLREAATVIILSPRKFFSSTSTDTFPFKVLLLQRNNRTRFMRNSFVFPGGVVDQRNDTKAEFWTKRGVSDSNIVPDDWKYRICALREAFEECGLCLTEPKLSLSWRKKVHADASALHEAVQQENACVQYNRLRPFERWITPKEESRRYDTRFYVTRIKSEEEMREINHDGEEMVNLAWISPPEALQKAREMVLPPPTWKILRDLTFLESSIDDFSDDTWFEKHFHNQFTQPIEPSLVMETQEDGTKSLKEVVLGGDRGRIVQAMNDELYRFEQHSPSSQEPVHNRSRL